MLSAETLGRVKKNNSRHSAACDRVGQRLDFFFTDSTECESLTEGNLVPESLSQGTEGVEVRAHSQALICTAETETSKM